jgi:hypothetical protein
MGKYLSVLSEVSENQPPLPTHREEKKVEIPTLTHCQNCQKSQKSHSARVLEWKQARLDGQREASESQTKPEGEPNANRN